MNTHAHAVMTFDQWAVITAWCSSVIFLVGYSLIAPWWRHPIGRAVAFLDLCLALALCPSMLHQLFDVNIQRIWFAWYYGCSLYLVSLVTLWRLVVIFMIQRRAAGRRRLLEEIPPQSADPGVSTAD